MGRVGKVEEILEIGTMGVEKAPVMITVKYPPEGRAVVQSKGQAVVDGKKMVKMDPMAQQVDGHFVMAARVVREDTMVDLAAVLAEMGLSAVVIGMVRVAVGDIPVDGVVQVVFGIKVGMIGV